MRSRMWLHRDAGSAKDYQLYGMKDGGAIERFLQQQLLEPPVGLESARMQLAALVQELINQDFYALVQLLYRVDVEEAKIKKLLAENAGSDSSALIADLLLQRTAAKRAARQAYRQGGEIPDHEKW